MIYRLGGQTQILVECGCSKLELWAIMKIFLNQAWLQIQVRKKKDMQKIGHNKKNKCISFFLGLDPYSARSCDLGQLTCHGSATCEDHSNGFCCKCINGWYGDGSTCLPKVLSSRSY